MLTNFFYLKKINSLIFILIIIIFIFSNCEGLFEYSPYSANIVDKKYTQVSIDRITRNVINTDSIKFAAISDVHYYYNELDRAVDHINRNNDISFVVIAGDLTDQGLLREYELIYDAQDDLYVPSLTVIGNHDYLSNGEKIYERFYGDYNYSFILGNYKFIFYDNIIWESRKQPDFIWLENELLENPDYFKVVISHMPPINDQFSTELSDQYIDLLNQYNVELSIHGHVHEYSQLNFGDTQGLIVGSVDSNQYCIITLYQNDSIKIERTSF